jgi:hypothetical protein
MATEITPRVRILGLRVARRAQDGNTLPGLVATFDAGIPLMSMFGASLYRRRDGAMTACPPRGERGDGTSTGVRIEDEALKAELTRAASDVARVFGANVDPWRVEAE